MDSIFTNGFPEGKIEYYVESDERRRISAQEDRMNKIDLSEIETSLRKAAEVHKEVRSYIQSKIRPGMRYWDICCDLEDKVRYLIGENGPNVCIHNRNDPIGWNGVSYGCVSESHRRSLYSESRRFDRSPVWRCGKV